MLAILAMIFFIFVPDADHDGDGYGSRREVAAPVVNVTQVYDGQIIGKVVQDQIQTSSALRQSLSTARPGHRRR